MPHIKFYKSCLNSNSNRATYKEFFRCSQIDLCNVWWFVFLSSWLTLLFWGAITLSFLICFSLIITVSNASRGGVQDLYGHQKLWSPPLGSGLPWVLKCLVTNWFSLFLRTIWWVKFFFVRNKKICFFNFEDIIKKIQYKNL